MQESTPFVGAWVFEHTKFEELSDSAPTVERQLEAQRKYLAGLTQHLLAFQDRKVESRPEEHRRINMEIDTLERERMIGGVLVVKLKTKLAEISGKDTVYIYDKTQAEKVRAKMKTQAESMAMETPAALQYIEQLMRDNIRQQVFWAAMQRGSHVKGMNFVTDINGEEEDVRETIKSRLSLARTEFQRDGKANAADIFDEKLVTRPIIREVRRMAILKLLAELVQGARPTAEILDELEALV